MTVPAVSIVLPSYNGARYLPEAITSVLNQTMSDWELIVVDDCSTDSTEEIIQSFARQDARIRPFRNEVNRKLPATLNVGFSHARGRYLTWTSDDNRYRPEALAELSAYLDQHSGVGLVYSDFSLIDEQGRATKDVVVGPPEDLAIRNVVVASFMYRRDVQEQLGGYSLDWVFVEDYEFWLRASEHYRIAALHRNLYEYRLHAHSLSSTRHKMVVETMLRLMPQHLPKMGWAGNQNLAGGYVTLAGYCLELGRRSQAGKFLALAFRQAPLHTLWTHKFSISRLLLGSRATQWLARRIGADKAASTEAEPCE
jgi:glycosyltransferase involved in cell wall biosynthesis